MPEVQRQQANRGTILLVIGALCVVFGLFLFSQRVGLAEIFLGAHFLFGIPVSSGDALKVLMVAMGTAAIVLQGIVIAVAGVILFSRNERVVASEGSVAPTHL
jgi:hypothetical protein